MTASSLRIRRRRFGANVESGDLSGATLLAAYEWQARVHAQLEAALNAIVQASRRAAPPGDVVEVHGRRNVPAAARRRFRPVGLSDWFGGAEEGDVDHAGTVAAGKGEHTPVTPD